jgi:hypothetical protein
MNTARVVILLSFYLSGWAQDIVLKSTFPHPSGYWFPDISTRTYPEIDVDNDGLKEIFTLSGYLNTTTLEIYTNVFAAAIYPQETRNGPALVVAVMRQQGLGEYTGYTPNTGWGVPGLRIHDIASSNLLFFCPDCMGNVVFDYDNDGLDDILTGVGNEMRVYGIANGNPVAPPQDLDIQLSGDDYIITWNSVPSATAYRILWSSSLDGVSFTRIGYTTDTSFTHRSRASEPMGFYRVMSEDNGTGVVRMVGQSNREEQ